MPDVSALLFDVFGTVVDWRSGVAREAAPFLARHGIAADPQAFADAWRGRYQPAMEEVRSGRRPFAVLDVLHRESLEATLREAGADPAELPRAELDDLNAPGTGSTPGRTPWRAWSGCAGASWSRPSRTATSG